MEAFFKILIVIANLSFVFYLLYFLRGLIKYGKNVFEHRNKTASIIVLILTLIQLGNKNDEETNSFKVYSSNLTSTSFETNYYQLEKIAFEEVNLFIKSRDINQDDILIEGILSQSGLVMGTKIKLIRSEIGCSNKQCFIETSYLKSWNIFGIQLYSQLKNKKTPLNSV